MNLCTFTHAGQQRVLQPASRYWLSLDGAPRQSLFDQIASDVPGLHGWLPGEAGLIANLRVWENCVLPLGYVAGKPDAAVEARFAHLLARMGISVAEQAAFAAAPAFSLSGRRRRLASALRTLLLKPALILAESEWFARLDAGDAPLLAGLFAEECAQSCWLVLGSQPPPAFWACQPVDDKDHHVAA